MSVPDYQELMLPVLRLGLQNERSMRECIENLAQEFELSDEERAELLPSGKQTRFANRVHWAKTYLAQAKLVEVTRRGFFRATDRGRRALSERPDRIDKAFLEQFEEFRDFQQRKSKIQPQFEQSTASERQESATPEERIDAAFEEINDELRAELLDRIIQSPPDFFEKLVVDLMVAMGYGGSLATPGKRIGRSGDGGVDGVINEDALGLDSVYIQAKRYSPGNNVGIEKVREFAGSLVERGASKGVFVTTSKFVSSARDYADRIPQKLVLIDGNTLTHLLSSYGVGVRTTRSVELKRLDLDYFDEGGG